MTIVAQFQGEQVEILGAFASHHKMATIKLAHYVTLYTHGGPIETNVINVRADLLNDVKTVEVQADECEP